MTDTPVSESYIGTIEEADAYFSNDPRAADFVNLEAAIKSWYLQRATKIIDSLPLRGRKYMLDGTQARQFPREYREGYDMNVLTGDAEVPQAVKDACCEEALELMLRIDTQRLRNQEEGISSQTIAGTSTTYIPGALNRYYGLLSRSAYNLMSKYIARSVPII